MTMEFSSLRGVYAAAITPLKPDLSPDLEAIPPYLNFLAQRGCHGALLLGTTGEGPSFSPVERAAIYKIAASVRSSLPSFHIFAGTGTPSLQETIELNRLVFENDLDGVVVLPPYYYKKITDEGLFRWFSAVIKNSVPAGKVLLAYHFPGISAIDLSIGLLARLKGTYPDRFAGLKDSSGDENFALQLGKEFGEELIILVGHDRLFTLALQAGASGCITAMANVFSPLHRQVWDAFQQGNPDGLAQTHLGEIRAIMDRYPPAPALLKALLSTRHQFPWWPVRPPLLDTPAEILEKAQEDLSAVAV